jgi:AcrR family transcriptional regulator
MNARRDASAAATRADLLFAARTLFVSQGYEAVTVRMIAQAAGKSTGALFAHWAGKDELFTEAMGRPPFTDAMGERLAQALRDAGIHPATVQALALNRAVF